jgi:hypothetical protein
MIFVFYYVTHAILIKMGNTQYSHTIYYMYSAVSVTINVRETGAYKSGKLMYIEKLLV